MASEATFSISAAAVVEEVLRQHGTRLSDTGLASRKAEEAVSRRNEAAGWLRKTVGVVGAKDLPEEPSEEEFRLGLRNGLILCNALNKIQPGAVPKVVVNPGDSFLPPEAAALSAYQYFENVRNFLVSVEEIGLPTFEASDLEQGGKGARVVNCVLALKSYSEWKQMGGNGSWKYGGNLKPSISGRYFARRNSEPFSNSVSRNQSVDEKLQDGFYMEQNSSRDFPVESNEMNASQSLHMLVRAALSEKKPEEVPTLLESILSKIMEEMEHRIASQNEMMKTALKDVADGNKSFLKQKVPAELASAPCVKNVKVQEHNSITREACIHEISKDEVASEEKLAKQLVILDQQHRDIQELKKTLYITKAGMKFLQMKYSEEFNTLGKHLHSLACAASGYQKILEENRKLYNQVQDLKGSIRVYCRVRPFLPGHLSSSTISNIDDGNITILTHSKYGKEGHRSFCFNKVFGPSASQDEVFSDTQPLIRSVLDGYNVCIFAYGQTGSGKTYTMSGPNDLNKQSQGVNYRALHDLFYLSEQRRDTFSYEIAVQMIEIYNEQVRDLLAGNGVNRRLEICNSSQSGLNVPNANLVPVRSTYDVIELMNIGQRNRAVGATALNDRSSRSHSCLTVHVQGRDMTSGTILRGCMHLVDLAGSERVNKSEVTGERLKEAQHINKSLSALGDVIAALAQKNSHVPYRNSKLTQLLQDSLGGQAKTLMFVHISPEMDAIGETISTLKFAERVSTVELGAARANKEYGEVKELKEQIASLKAALARKEAEPAHSQRTIPCPGAVKMKTGVPIPMCPAVQQQNFGSFHRQPMEDVGNIEVLSNRTSRQKGRSFDLQELIMGNDSTPWPDSSAILNDQNCDEKETGCGDWVDKVMVNKHEYAVRYDNSPGDWTDGADLSDFFYQRYMHDTRSSADEPINQNGSLRKKSHELEIQRSRFDSDSDELDIATSDSSEADALWQFNLPSVSSNIDGSGSRIKKLQVKSTKSPDIRTPVHPQIPSPSQKMSNGSGHGLNRMGRQPPSGGSGTNLKRASSGGKTGSGK